MARALCFIALAALPLVYFSRDHRLLAAEYSVGKADIGIPGITKMYEAHLTNRGFLPARIQVCTYLTDAFEKGRTPAYSIEQFDSQQGTWQTLLDLSQPSYCRPYPLGWVKASLQDIWLWPGQSVGIEPEATGARSHLKGKSLRFLVFDSYGTPQKRKAFGTQSFVVDEQLETEGEGLRVRH